MRKYLGDTLWGMIVGFLMFFMPSLTTGLYGFWGFDFLYDNFDKSGVVTLLSLLYLCTYFILFLLYRIVRSFISLDSLGKNQVVSFLFFLFGGVIGLIVYLATGVIGFSSGDFGL
ncbi:MAG: hypothetical protein A2855_03005 [Candidatus Liptonbacteria bacterium RIFCSPHIGHO2_01_FULL_57_28]|uniref:Uncharacterized protein n=1 Tax=Candidatus Liptonbacteria bacterium RIFCSPHIGHO2_01_FULL_57_28 TaxID=1798647 RepID=A0A1G2C8W8_9BACT|nr:MAG: hypothetical protein A2855_03005 [Candidatus Liptonbacteria bacterium RIFCSPHIGHO2_01_FULL_57_28]